MFNVYICSWKSRNEQFNFLHGSCYEVFPLEWQYDDAVDDLEKFLDGFGQ